MIRSRREFAAVPESVGQARRFVASVLRGHQDAVPVAQLVTGELAANAVLHARTPFDVQVEANGEIAISVIDHVPDPPVLREPTTDAPNGRGILLVDRLADAWGVEPLPTGKRVWCRLRSRLRPG